MDFSISPLTKDVRHAAVPQARREAPIELAAVPAMTAPAVDESALADRVEELNHAFKAADDHLQFTVHKGTNQIVIRLVDNATDEVLREFPSEKFLDLVARLQKLAGTKVDVTL
ncbi:MAG: flagellar protein FlaG [Candidatus Sericytochromatia bacterium]